MNKIITILMVFLLISGCSNKSENSIDDSTINETMENIEEVITENEKEYTFEDFESEALKCMSYYYSKQNINIKVNKIELMYTDFNWNDGYIWEGSEFEIGDNYPLGFWLIQYKDNPLDIYHGNDLIWKDGQPYGTKTAFRRGYPELLQILDSPIRIRQDHNTDSDVIKLANPDEQYLYFDSYDDGQYIWYKVYLEDTKTYGWLASDKNDPWIGQLA